MARATPLTVDPAWVAEGERLAARGGATPFEIGDWLAKCRRPQGQVFTDAERIFGLATGTLSAYQGIARRIAPADRAEGVGVNGHQAVMGLPPAEQRRLLGEVVARRLSSKELQLRMLAARAEGAP